MILGLPIRTGSWAKSPNKT